MAEVVEVVKVVKVAEEMEVEEAEAEPASTYKLVSYWRLELKARTYGKDWPNGHMGIGAGFVVKNHSDEVSSRLLSY